MSSVPRPQLVKTVVFVGFSVLLAAGCVRTVDGSATAGPNRAAPLTTTTTVRAAPTGPVGPMLLAPADFPPGYPATILDAQAIGQALGDIDGVPAGATVDPAACAPTPPPADPQDVAAAVGTNDAASSTITVAVLRVAEPLSAYKDRVQRCPTFTVTSQDQVTSTVTISEAVAPPINADDSVAFNQSVSAGSGGGTQTTLTLAAQIADIRIAATYMTFQGSEPDAVLLDQAFTAAVLKVHDSFN